MSISGMIVVSDWWIMIRFELRCVRLNEMIIINKVNKMIDLILPVESFLLNDSFSLFFNLFEFNFQLVN
jgi:hypothetical protein